MDVIRAISTAPSINSSKKISTWGVNGISFSSLSPINGHSVIIIIDEYFFLPFSRIHSHSLNVSTNLKCSTVSPILVSEFRTTTATKLNRKRVKIYEDTYSLAEYIETDLNQQETTTHTHTHRIGKKAFEQIDADAPVYLPIIEFHWIQCRRERESKKNIW